MSGEGPDSVPFDGEVITTAQPTRVLGAHGANPFSNGHDERTNAGAVAIESQRATAEVQGRMVVAQRFPRSTTAAYAMAMEACKRIGLAECAIYTYTKGQKVEGPSIRLAEELARVWGNIEYGINELSRTPGAPGVAGSSEMEAFAWDLQTNTRSSQRFTVAHIRDKSDGGKILTSERDIYEITANQGARRMRARILAILPPELVDDAVAVCKETIKSGGSQPFSERVRILAVSFGQLGVSAKMLSEWLSGPLDNMTPDQLVNLRGIYQQIKDGAKVSEFFGEAPKSGSRLDQLENTVAKSTTKPAMTAQAYIAGVEAAQDEAALDRFINDGPSRDAIKAMSAEDRKQCDIAVQAARKGFKPGQSLV